MEPGTRFESHLMRTIAFALFPTDEQEDFRSSCRRWRKSPDEFRVTAEEEELGPPAPIQRDVVVVHPPTGKARRYSAGSGTNWNIKFDEDLQAAYFTHARINVNEPYELAYWTNELGVSEKTLRDAVARVGVMVSAVRAHLNK
jgi:Protein of unknown function (DUF3606)